MGHYCGWELSPPMAAADQDVDTRYPDHGASTEDRAVDTSAWNEAYPNVPEDFTITEKAPPEGAYKPRIIGSGMRS